MFTHERFASSNSRPEWKFCIRDERNLCVYGKNDLICNYDARSSVNGGTPFLSRNSSRITWELTREIVEARRLTNNFITIVIIFYSFYIRYTCYLMFLSTIELPWLNIYSNDIYNLRFLLKYRKTHFFIYIFVFFKVIYQALHVTSNHMWIYERKFFHPGRVR